MGVDDGLRLEIFELEEEIDPRTGEVVGHTVLNKKTREPLFPQIRGDGGDVYLPIHFRKDKKQLD